MQDDDEEITQKQIQELKTEITARLNAVITVYRMSSAKKPPLTHEEEQASFLAIFVDLNEKTSVFFLLLSLFSWRKTSVLIKYVAKLDGYSDLNMLNISLRASMLTDWQKVIVRDYYNFPQV